MKSYLWDTGALSLIFADHKEAVGLIKQIKSNTISGMVPQVILAEFYYKTWQNFGEQAAQIRTISLKEDTLEVVPISNNDIFTIGELKVKYPSLSLADAILITIAKKTKSTILTTDNLVKDIKECKVKKLEF